MNEFKLVKVGHSWNLQSKIEGIPTFFSKDMYEFESKFNEFFPGEHAKYLRISREINSLLGIEQEKMKPIEKKIENLDYDHAITWWFGALFENICNKFKQILSEKKKDEVNVQ